MIRTANENDIDKIVKIYEHIHDAEEAGEAGIVFCNFNGIPDVRLVCLEKEI